MARADAHGHRRLGKTRFKLPLPHRRRPLSPGPLCHSWLREAMVVTVCNSRARCINLTGRDLPVGQCLGELRVVFLGPGAVTTAEAALMLGLLGNGVQMCRTIESKGRIAMTQMLRDPTSVQAAKELRKHQEVAATLISHGVPPRHSRPECQ